MSIKRKPPALQRKEQEVNKKALLWIGGIFVVLVAVITLLLIFT